MEILVSKLKHHPLNKEIYTLSSIGDLVESIREVGLLEGLVVDQKNQVISGNRRLEGSVINLIEKISKYSSDKLTGEVLVSIKSFGEFSSEDAEMINLASDEPNKCYIRFRNGVVVITKSSIQLVPYSRFETEGSVWEASIIPRDIKIEKDPNHRGLFEKFVFNSMRTRDHKIEAMSEWMDEYPITDNVRTNFEALRSGNRERTNYLRTSSEICLWFQGGRVTKKFEWT